MCIGGSPAGNQAMQMPMMPAAPPPGPTPVSAEVVNTARAQKTRAAASSGYGGTIANGGAGLLMPAFTTGSAGFKMLTGQ